MFTYLQTLSKRRIGALEGALIHWRAKLRPKPQKNLANQQPVTLRRRRENVKSEANWKLFYHKFAIDHATSALIWNYKVSFDRDLHHRSTSQV